MDDYAHLNPAFVKFDVEGFEYQALQGRRYSVAKAETCFELHTDKLSKYETSVEKVLNMIGLDRYRLWIQWNDSEEPKEYDNKALSQSVFICSVFQFRNENPG